MEVRTLFIIRALPGAGKSTLASLLAPEDAICTTDDYPGLYTYLDNGEVIFHGGGKVDGVPMIVAAHTANQEKAESLMSNGALNVVVPNTNTQRWEFQPYLDLASKFGYRVTVLSIFDGGATDQELLDRNTHGVPLDAISNMRERFEHDWKSADARPPWERN